MIYKQHIRHKRELRQAMTDYSDAIDEKMELFQRTQPSSPGTREGSSSRVSGTDKIDSYLIQMERKQIDERLKDAREIVEAMKERLKNDEALLEMSLDTRDRVYFRRFIQRRPVPDVASIEHYSQSYVFKIVKEIETEMEKG